MMLFVCFVGMLGKKEEGLKWGDWVGVSLGFLIGYFRITQYVPELGLYYKNVGR